MRKLTLEIEFDIDGESPSDEVIERAFMGCVPGVLLSEDIDKTEDYAICVESVTAVKIK
jgi:hypothetical protein